MDKYKIELIKEFRKKYCGECNAFFACGGDWAGCGCIAFEKFMKKNKNE